MNRIFCVMYYFQDFFDAICFRIGLIFGISDKNSIEPLTPFHRIFALFWMVHLNMSSAPVGRHWHVFLCITALADVMLLLTLQFAFYNNFCIANISQREKLFPSLPKTINNMKYLASLDFDLRLTYKIKSTSNEPTF